jgi:hypothetical protein
LLSTDEIRKFQSITKFPSLPRSILQLAKIALGSAGDGEPNTAIAQRMDFTCILHDPRRQLAQSLLMLGIRGAP